MTDSYITLSKETYGEFRDRGSKFLAFGFECASESALKVALSKVKALHPSARHFCFAAITDFPSNTHRVSDDGEPSGTAGLPILNRILSRNLNNAVVIVVRYFGGVKLGKSGLIHAYKEATDLALDNVRIKKCILMSRLQVTYDYTDTGDVLRIIERIPDSVIVKHDFHEQTTTLFKTPKSQLTHTLTLFKHLKSVSIENMAD